MVLEPPQEVGAVAVNPGDAVGNAIHVGVILGAGEGSGIDFDANYMGPVVCAGEGDGVATCTGEEVDYGAAAGPVGVGLVFAMEFCRDFAAETCQCMG